MRSINRRRHPFARLKFLALLLGVQVVCLLLWGLTWPQPLATELSFVVPQDEIRPWQTVVAEFEKSHPDIRINLVTDLDTGYTTDQRKAIYTADFQADEAQYDLVYMDIVWPLQFADSLQDLTPYIERDKMALSGFLASEVAAGQLDGRLYRIPMRADVGVLYYRQDLLNQQDLPVTVAELLQVVGELETTGYLWQGSRYEGLVANFVEILAGLGGTWIDPVTGKATLDAPLTLKAASLLKQLIEQGISPDEVITYTEQDTLQRFLDGQAVFLRGWPYFWEQIQQSDVADKVEIAPPFSFSNNPGLGCRGGWGFGIPNNSAYPEEAWEAIQYFTSEDAQRQFVLESGYLPSRPGLFQDPDIVAKYPQMPQMLEYLEQGSTFRPFIPEYGAASEILQFALANILSGQQTAETAMAQAQAETEALLQASQGG
ncbi:MAG: ABC transporter substrate-binding protein [Cyanobacteria bacterium P01_D01_bin.56]